MSLFFFFAPFAPLRETKAFSLARFARDAEIAEKNRSIL